MITPQALAAWAEYRSIVQGPALAVVDRVWPDACREARITVAPHTAAQAWAECPRADWMLWAAARIGVARRLVVRAACACARTVLHMVAPGEDRPRVAIETSEAWSRGEASIGQIRTAAWAAWAAAGAARAAEAAAWAAWAASYTGSKEDALARMADLVREHITLDDIAAGVEGRRRLSQR